MGVPLRDPVPPTPPQTHRASFHLGEKAGLPCPLSSHHILFGIKKGSQGQVEAAGEREEVIFREKTQKGEGAQAEGDAGCGFKDQEAELPLL